MLPRKTVQILVVGVLMFSIFLIEGLWGFTSRFQTISWWSLMLSFTLVITLHNKVINTFLVCSTITMGYLVFTTAALHSFDLWHFVPFFMAIIILVYRKPVSFQWFMVFLPLLILWSNAPFYYPIGLALTACYTVTFVIVIMLHFKPWVIIPP